MALFWANTANSANTTASSNASSVALTQAIVNTVAGYTCCGELLLTNIGASQTIYPAFYGIVTYLNTNTPTITVAINGGYATSTGCNAFQLLFSSGNITSGTFSALCGFIIIGRNK